MVLAARAEINYRQRRLRAQRAIKAHRGRPFKFERINARAWAPPRTRAAGLAFLRDVNAVVCGRAPVAGAVGRLRWGWQGRGGPRYIGRRICVGTSRINGMEIGSMLNLAVRSAALPPVLCNQL